MTLQVQPFLRQICEGYLNQGKIRSKLIQGFALPKKKTENKIVNPQVSRGEEQEQEERSHKTLMILHSSPLFEENDNYLRLEKTYKTHQKVTLIAFTRQMFPFHTKLPIRLHGFLFSLIYHLFLLF